jgi:hypothetical protein
MATYTKSVTSTLTPLQQFGDVMPKVTTTLVHSQVIVGVLPKITTTLVFNQTISCNIKQVQVISLLKPVQIIGTDDSVLGENISVPESIVLTGTVTFQKSSTKSTTLTLAHSQRIAGKVDNIHSENIWE